MRIAIIGRSEILYNTVELLCAAGHTIIYILTAKEAPEYIKTGADFERLAANLQVPFANTAKIESQATMLRELKADVAISVNYSGVIPQSITDLFPMGILNAHGGDLPRYRGNACQAWAILNGEEKIGLCIHRMIGGELDSGDILSRDYIAINHSTKVTEVWDWMNERVPSLFLEAIEMLSERPNYILEAQSKNPEDALRCYPRKPEDGRIEWNKSNIDILRLINACNKPYSGAFCEFENEKLIIWDATIAPHENFLAIPGQVTAITKDFVEIACGSGKLCVKKVEYLGKQCLPHSLFKSLRQRVS